MNARVVAAVLYLGLVSSATPAGSAVKVDKWRPIDYPVIARLARIEGTVVIRATLKKGDSSEYRVDKYKVKSGHPLLAEAAAQNLKQQSFYCGCESLEEAEYEITYEFRLDKDCLEEQQCFKRSSTFRSGHVVVEADVPMVHAYTIPIRSK
jgi:hypothetical protein